MCVKKLIRYWASNYAVFVGYLIPRWANFDYFYTANKPNFSSIIYSNIINHCSL